MIGKIITQKISFHRFSLLFFLFFTGFGVIVVRLLFLQCYKSSYFQHCAYDQYTKKIVLHHERKPFYDRHKIPLAYNATVHSVFVLLPQCTQRDNLISFLKTSFPQAHNFITTHPEQSFIWIKRNINESEKELCKNARIPGINIVEETRRFYPCDFLAPLLGSTDIDNKGIEGLELYYDKEIRGAPSSALIQKDARARTFYFMREMLDEGKRGKSIELTLDSELSKKVYHELEKTVQSFSAQSGNVLILDPETGAIITMVSYPSRDGTKTLRNSCVTDCFEFGSVVKPLVALAALEEGVVSIDEKIDCEGTVAYVAKTRVENIKPLNVLSFADVIRYSSNVGIAKVGVRLGERMYYHLERLGFGQRSGIDFPGERTGKISVPHAWSRSTPVVMSFGYEMNATLLQLARAYACLANGGCLITPYLKKGEGRPKSEPLFSQQSIDHLRTILEAGNSSVVKIKPFIFLGKTGTARVATQDGYSSDRHIYTFAGIVERGNYKRVIVTFIREPHDPNLLAYSVAAPLFSRIAHAMIVHDVVAKNCALS